MTNLKNFYDLAKLKRVDELKGRVKSFFTDAEIIEFAKNYDCPHYILTHPKTKEESILFIASEVDDWLVIRYLTQHKCLVPQTINFTSFDYDNHKIAHYDRVPKELVNVTDLYRLPKSTMQTPPGVYFLCQDIKIVYVGQSINVGSRINQHYTEKTKIFDTVFFIPCHISTLNSIEFTLIRYLQPKYNNSMPEVNMHEDQIVLKSLKIVA